MTLASVSSATQSAATQSPASASDKANKAAMDKDAFLKLLVAQLAHQDPLQPTEGTEFITQLSQFALVEQSIAQSSKLDVVSAQLAGMSSNEAVGLVGKDVTVRGNGIAFDGIAATSSSVNLSANAAKVTVQIQDKDGKTVRTLEMGARTAGPMPIAWDGKDDSGVPAARGTYSMKVEARTADDSIVNAAQDVAGKVTKVAFDKGYPELTLDSGVTAPISDLVSVSGGSIR
ncbi:MAG: flagellar hook assembly protein FlgD [Labilithrix sp.]|nr:flagellar hook assembly protein FlgD [Labilithrix sp.]MCW5817153.1 flagellar hook assembly protein FlgD [Labilithrix sp.]